MMSLASTLPAALASGRVIPITCSCSSAAKRFGTCREHPEGGFHPVRPKMHLAGVQDVVDIFQERLL